jgi:hypothetical protein
MAMHVFSQGDLISIAQFDLDQHQSISSPQTECNSLLSLCPHIKQRASHYNTMLVHTLLYDACMPHVAACRSSLADREPLMHHTQDMHASGYNKAGGNEIFGPVALAPQMN